MQTWHHCRIGSYARRHPAISVDELLQALVSIRSMSYSSLSLTFFSGLVNRYPLVDIIASRSVRQRQSLLSLSLLLMFGILTRVWRTVSIPRHALFKVQQH